MVSPSNHNVIVITDVSPETQDKPVPAQRIRDSLKPKMIPWKHDKKVASISIWDHATFGMFEGDIKKQERIEEVFIKGVPTAIVFMKLVDDLQLPYGLRCQLLPRAMKQSDSSLFMELIRNLLWCSKHKLNTRFDAIQMGVLALPSLGELAVPLVMELFLATIPKRFIGALSPLLSFVAENPLMFPDEQVFELFTLANSLRKKFISALARCRYRCTLLVRIYIEQKQINPIFADSMLHVCDSDVVKSELEVWLTNGMNCMSMPFCVGKLLQFHGDTVLSIFENQLKRSIQKPLVYKDICEYWCSILRQDIGKLNAGCSKRFFDILCHFPSVKLEACGSLHSYLDDMFRINGKEIDWKTDFQYLRSCSAKLTDALYTSLCQIQTTRHLWIAYVSFTMEFPDGLLGVNPAFGARYKIVAAAILSRLNLSNKKQRRSNKFGITSNDEAIRNEVAEFCLSTIENLFSNVNVEVLRFWPMKVEFPKSTLYARDVLFTHCSSFLECILNPTFKNTPKALSRLISCLRHEDPLEMSLTHLKELCSFVSEGVVGINNCNEPEIRVLLENLFEMHSIAFRARFDNDTLESQKAFDFFSLNSSRYLIQLSNEFSEFRIWLVRLIFNHLKKLWSEDRLLKNGSEKSGLESVFSVVTCIMIHLKFADVFEMVLEFLLYFKQLAFEDIDVVCLKLPSRLPQEYVRAISAGKFVSREIMRSKSPAFFYYTLIAGIVDLSSKESLLQKRYWCTLEILLFGDFGDTDALCKYWLRALNADHDVSRNEHLYTGLIIATLAMLRWHIPVQKWSKFDLEKFTVQCLSHPKFSDRQNSNNGAAALYNLESFSALLPALSSSPRVRGFTAAIFDPVKEDNDWFMAAILKLQRQFPEHPLQINLFKRFQFRATVAADHLNSVRNIPEFSSRHASLQELLNTFLCLNKASFVSQCVETYAAFIVNEKAEARLALLSDLKKNWSRIVSLGLLEDIESSLSYSKSLCRSWKSIVSSCIAAVNMDKTSHNTVIEILLEMNHAIEGVCFQKHKNREVVFGWFRLASQMELQLELFLRGSQVKDSIILGMNSGSFNADIDINKLESALDDLPLSEIHKSTILSDARNNIKKLEIAKTQIGNIDMDEYLELLLEGYKAIEMHQPFICDPSSSGKAEAVLARISLTGPCLECPWYMYPAFSGTVQSICDCLTGSCSMRQFKTIVSFLEDMVVSFPPILASPCFKKVFELLIPCLFRIKMDDEELSSSQYIGSNALSLYLSSCLAERQVVTAIEH